MKRLKPILGLLLVAAVFYTAFAVAPHYFSYYQFQDDLSTEAKFAPFGAYGQPKSEEELLTNVMKKVHEYNLPITPEMVRISRGSDGRQVEIAVDYKVTVHLPLEKKLELEFHPRSKK